MYSTYEKKLAEIKKTIYNYIITIKLYIKALDWTNTCTKNKREKNYYPIGRSYLRISLLGRPGREWSTNSIMSPVHGIYGCGLKRRRTSKFNNQATIIKNHMYKVLNNGQLHAICDHIETAIALIKTLEMNIDRMLCHSPFTIEVVDSE